MHASTFRRLQTGLLAFALVATEVTVLLVGSPAAAGAVTRFTPVSVGPDGEVMSGDSVAPDISADGRLVAFASGSDLDGGSATGAGGIFVRDRAATGPAERVSVGAGGAPLDGGVGLPLMSASGRFVAFEALADGIAGDANGQKDVYLRDRANASTWLVSLENGGVGQATSPVDLSAIRESGGTPNVVWDTDAGMAAGDMTGPTGRYRDVYLTQRGTDGAGWVETAWISYAGSTAERFQANGPSYDGDTSEFVPGLGQLVVFVSEATDLVPGVETTLPRVYLRNLSTDALTLVSDHATGARGSYQPRISPDGSTIVYATTGDPTDRTGLATFASPQVVAYDVRSASSWILSDGGAGPTTSEDPTAVPDRPGAVTLSHDGRWASFVTSAPGLVPGDDVDGTPNAFVVDLGGTDAGPQLIGPGADVPADHPRVANDGSVHVFSTATALHPQDTNGASDVYARTEETPPPAPPAHVDVSLSQREVPVGAEQVPISAIPADRIPVGSTEVGSTPLRGVDLLASPLRGVPLRGVPLRGVPLRGVPLRGVPLRGVDVGEAAPTWEVLLQGTQYQGLPLETVTLEEILLLLDPNSGLPTDHPLRALTLGHIDLSSTPLRGVSVGSLLLGSTPLRGVPLRGVDLGTCPVEGQNGATAEDENLCLWQQLADALGLGITIDGTTILLDLDVAGGDMRSVPLRGVPLRGVDLSAAPLRGVPLRGVMVHSAPLRGVPLRGVVLAGTPLRGVPLADLTDLAAIVDCDVYPDCQTPGKTLEDVPVAAIRTTATLGMLTDVMPADMTIGDLLANLDHAWLDANSPDFDQQLTLGAILIGLLYGPNFPWEEIPAEDMALQQYSTVATSEVRVAVEASPGRLAPDATTYEVEVVLPTRARYRAGSAQIQAYREVGVPTGAFAPLDDPLISGNTLTWTIPHDEFEPVAEVSFDLLPGLRLETTAVEAHMRSAESASDSATLVVTERYEGVADHDDDPANARPIPEDTLVIGHLGTPGDVDYFEVADPGPGKRISVLLSGLTMDGDLVLYRPTTAVQGAEDRAVPLRAPVVPADEPSHTGTISGLSPQTLADVPIADLQVQDLSTARGTGDERIDAPTTGGTGPLTIQVSAYNGGSGTSPYVLRVRVTDEPAYEPCEEDPFEPAYAGVPAAGLAPVDAASNTLFVVNQERLGAQYGPGEAKGVMDALQQLSARHDLGVRGHVLSVDGDAPVRDLYGDWDQEPCSPAAANAVVDGIIGLIEDVRAQAPGISSVVVVGGDTAVPFARLQDLTTISNERDYTSAVGVRNQLSGAFGSEHVLSDDPYADHDPIPYFNRRLFVPDVALGRLVETPGDIMAAVEAFQTAEGFLEIGTALVTGYDFLTDGAHAVADAVDGGQVTSDRTLISDTWTRAELVTALLGVDETGAVVGTPPDLASVNAHFDHYQSLPGEGNATHDETDLFTVEHVTASGADTLEGRLLFSMGCHSGLNVPDVMALAGAVGADWAETLARQGALYVGNTGFGYGDTDAVALSERLMAGFADRLDQLTVGQALTFAKQGYVSQLGAYGPYDEKVINEATLYGLPMYRLRGMEPAGVQSATLQAVEPARTTATDPHTGLEVFETTITPTFDEIPSKDGLSRHLVVSGELPQVTHGRPIQPRTDLDVTMGGMVAKGALVTGLTSDEEAVSATFARPVTDLSAHEPAITADVAFPGSFQSVNRGATPAGPEDRLVLVPGQFIPDDDPGTPAGTGIQRRFTSMDVQVLYGSESDTDWEGPRFSTVTAAPADGGMSFEVAVDDDSEVARVLVLYLDAVGTWHTLDLEPNGTAWTGTGALPVGDTVSYFVQAVDRVGNLSVTSDKDTFFVASGDVTAPTATIATPTEGQTVDQASSLVADYACSDANSGVASCTGAVGGVPVADGGALPTDSPGNHTLTVTATDRSGNETTTSATYVVVEVDTADPVATITAPSDGQEVFRGATLSLDAGCSDDREGVTRTVTVNGGTLVGDTLPTDVLGTFEVVVTCTDAAGNTHTTGVTYTVVPPPDAPDVGDPTIVLTTPADDGSTTIHRGGNLPAAYSCSDEHSAIAQCSAEVGGVTVAPGAALPTDVVGQHTVVVTASDAAGNTASVSTTYTVTWTRADQQPYFSPPIDDGVYNTVKAGSSVPVKFQIISQGRSVSDRAAIDDVVVVRSACESDVGVDSSELQSTVDPDGLRWDEADQQWVYVWRTAKGDQGCATLTVHLSDGVTVLRARFRFK